MNTAIQQAEQKLSAAEQLVAEARAELESARKSEPVYTHVVRGSGNIEAFDNRMLLHHKIAEQGRAFTSLAEADLFKKRERLLHRYREKIRELNDGWVADLGRLKKKYYFGWDHSDNSAFASWDVSSQRVENSMYFKPGTYDALKQDFTPAELRLILTGRELVE